MRVSITPRTRLVAFAWAGIGAGLAGITAGLCELYGWAGAALMLGAVLLVFGVAAAAELGKKG